MFSCMGGHPKRKRPNWKNSPSWLKGWPARALRIISMYSRVRATGFSKLCPCHCSMSNRPLEPNPKIARPLDIWSSEAMVCAMRAGLRLKTGTMPVPTRIDWVWQAIMVRTVKASRPQDSPVKKVW